MDKELVEKQRKFMSELSRRYYIGLELTDHFTKDSF